MIIPVCFTYFQASRDGFRTKSNRIQGSRLTEANIEMQFWLVGFRLSLAKMASENFRHFSGKKLQIEIDSERTELTSTLLTYIKEYEHTEIPKSTHVDTLKLYLYHNVFLTNKFIQSRTEPKFLREKM